MIKIIHGEIWSQDFSQLNQLIENFSSCVRFSFCRFQKDKLTFNNIRTSAKIRYPSLNARQAADAVLQAQGLYTKHKDNKVIFGGRPAWDKYQSGLISKEQWKNNKNNQIYSRGEKTHLGNANIRVVGDHLRVTIGRRQFVSYSLFIPNKYQEELQWLLSSGQSYNVRLIRKDAHHFKVNIDYSIADPQTTVNFNNGAIGIDVNPDRISLAEITKEGNYITSTSLCNQRIFFASTEKRQYEISLLVKSVIEYAKEKQKGIVVESLKFKKQWDNNKKWNRIKSNFVYNKFLTLLERKCIEHGIEYQRVHPAYTSIIGRLKYKELYQLNVHESAAYVIARRGLGYNEKLSLTHYPKKRVKEAVLRHLAGKKNKRVHSWVMWNTLRDNEQAVLTGLSSSIFNLQELNDASTDLLSTDLLSLEYLDSLDTLGHEGGIPSSKIFLPELVIGSEKNTFQERERSPSKTKLF